MRTCEGGAGGGAGVARHQELVVVLPGQGAVDHPVAVCLGLAVVPGELEAGGAPRAHPQVLGGIDLCATQGTEARCHRGERTPQPCHSQGGQPGDPPYPEHGLAGRAGTFALTPCSAQAGRCHQEGDTNAGSILSKLVW